MRVSRNGVADGVVSDEPGYPRPPRLGSVRFLSARVVVPAVAWALLVTVPLVGVFAADTGAAACVKPSIPLCIDDTTTFVSADKMIACQSAVKTYIDETMSYLSCLKDDHLTIGDELTRNVNRFNCRLGGRSDCW